MHVVMFQWRELLTDTLGPVRGVSNIFLGYLQQITSKNLFGPSLGGFPPEIRRFSEGLPRGPSGVR